MVATLAALKVKPKWLRLMRGRVVRGKTLRKTVELRKYLPESRTPRGHTPVAVGDRVYLVAQGEVWGSAVVGGVHKYTDVPGFLADADRHCVNPEGKGLEAELLSSLDASGLYGWLLEDFRWFPDGARPRSGQTYNNTKVPPFNGQACGWVWCTSRLPAALEAISGS